MDPVAATDSAATTEPRTCATSEVDWPTLGILIAVHGALVACFFVPPTRAALTLLAAFLTCASVGVTVGFHRHLAHRAFECGPWLTRVLALAGTTGLQGGPVFWVGLHRQHHQLSDQVGDPHSPRERFLEGHMLWMARKSIKSSAVLRAWSARDLRDINRDPFMRFLDRGVGPLVPWLLTLAICGAFGNVSGLVWGGVVRTVIGWHATWAVNSVGHRWGARPYATQDGSRNVWWLSLLSFGESWHNNHHAKPRAAMMGERWWQLDISGVLIFALERAGVIWNVQRPTSRVPAAGELGAQ